MTTPKSLFARDDTFFGVCEGLGQDFGVNPNYLRVAFGVALLWNPEIVIGVYLTLGLLVMASRWLFPATRVEVAEALPAARPLAENDAEEPELALAA